MSDIANNDGLESKLEDFNWLGINPDNLDKLYNIYNWLLAVSAFLTSRLLAVLAFLTSKSSFFFFF